MLLLQAWLKGCVIFGIGTQCWAGRRLHATAAQRHPLTIRRENLESHGLAHVMRQACGWFPKTTRTH